MAHLPEIRLPKPRWRGRIHQVAFFVSIPLGIALVASSRGVKAGVAATIFAVSLTGLYGVSAAYHRGNWSEQAERVWRRLDHSMIYVLIAATYTPITLLALRPAWGVTLLALVWTGAVVGITITVLRLERLPKLPMILYLCLGWAAVIMMPAIVQALRPDQIALLLAGGIVYTVGAVGLARRRPDPNPRVFGYHEVWHVLVVTAGACHYVLVLLLVR